jgi:hypothetical protein
MRDDDPWIIEMLWERERLHAPWRLAGTRPPSRDQERRAAETSKSGEQPAWNCLSRLGHSLGLRIRFPLQRPTL